MDGSGAPTFAHLWREIGLDSLILGFREYTVFAPIAGRLPALENALNAPSKRAAERLGFTFEGTHRMHMVAKGRRRDSDWYSIIEDEWPSRRDALLGWLAPENFAPDGTALRGLAEIRG